MLRLFFFDRPRLRHRVHPQRPAQLPPQGVVRPKDLFLRPVLPLIQRVFRLIQKKRVGLVQHIMHQRGDAHRAGRGSPFVLRPGQRRFVIQPQQQAVMIVQRCPDNGLIALNFRVCRKNIAGQRVINARVIGSLDRQTDVLASGNVIVVGFPAMG